MNNIAVIVYGLLREFEIAQQSWNFLRELNCDFYFSTWSKSYHNSWWRENPKIDVNEGDITKYFPNAKVSIMDENDEDLRKKIGLGDFDNSKKMIFHWKNGLRLINESGKKYDQIILNRSDVFYELITEDIKKFYYFKEPNTLYNRSGLTNHHQKTYTTDDLFFIGEFYTVSKFINELNYYNQMSVHDYLAYEIIKLNINLIPITNIFDMSIVRGNVKELDEITLKKIKEKFKFW